MKAYICILLFSIFTQYSSGASRCNTVFTALISNVETRTFYVNVGANFFTKMGKININEFIGEKYGRLTIIGEAPFVRTRGFGKKRFMAFVRCDCGKEKAVHFRSVITQETKSCGCAHSLRDKSSYSRSHGQGGVGKLRTSEYSTWASMKTRCLNPKSISYPNYGGRGINICEAWIHSFANFYNDLGPKPSAKHTLEREDNNGNYCKENCRWATRKEQRINTRIAINSPLFTYCGQTMCLTHWSRVFGINQPTLHRRIHKLGMSFEQAIKSGPPKINKRVML